MIDLDEIKHLMSVYGWEQVKTKNGNMISFVSDEAHINYYHTTSTVTKQDFHGGFEAIHDATLLDIEGLCSNL
jgi:hypothetical protein